MDVDMRFEEVPKGKLYLERVEAAAMEKLVECINQMDLFKADQLVTLLHRLSIV